MVIVHSESNTKLGVVNQPQKISSLDCVCFYSQRCGEKGEYFAEGGEISDCPKLMGKRRLVASQNGKGRGGDPKQTSVSKAYQIRGLGFSR